MKFKINPDSLVLILKDDPSNGSSLPSTPEPRLHANTLLRNPGLKLNIDLSIQWSSETLQ
jgi:hypothetical protein